MFVFKVVTTVFISVLLLIFMSAGLEDSEHRWMWVMFVITELMSLMGMWA